MVHINLMTPQMRDSLRQRRYRERHPERRRNQIRDSRSRAGTRKYVESNRNWYRANINKILLISARTRAKAKEVPFNLTIDDVIVPEFCPVLKIKIQVGHGTSRGTGKSDNSPSLDRIIPALGYVKGNVQVISWKANRMKSDASTEELLNFGDWALKTFGSAINRIAVEKKALGLQ